MRYNHYIMFFRNLISRLLLALFVFIISLICLELLLRRFMPITVYHMDLNDYIATNDAQIYEPRPNSNLFNANGFRENHDISLQKPDTVTRIEVLGDSLAFGLWLRPDETFSKLLEKKLNENPVNQQTYEVLNMGVPGYNISQVVNRFKQKGLLYKPDIALYYYWLDDSYISDGGMINVFTNPVLRTYQQSYNHIAAHQSTLLDDIINRFFNLQIGRHIIRHFLPGDITTRTLTTEDKTLYEHDIPTTVVSLYTKFITTYKNGGYKDIQGFEQYYAAYVDYNNFLYWNHNILEFSNTCKKEQISCIVLLTPVLYMHTTREYNWSGLHAFITDVFHEYGLSVIDLTREFEKYNGQDLRAVTYDPEHPDALGNQIISDNLYQKIESLESNK
jgi:hypothetical protein